MWKGYTGFVILEALVAWVIGWAIVLHDWLLLVAAICAMIICVGSCYRYLRRYNKDGTPRNRQGPQGPQEPFGS
jgi:hypothetical protein